MLIREIKLEDAGALLKLVKQVESESEYMMLEPGERTTDIVAQENMIKAFQKKHNSTILVAEHNNEIIGYLLVIGDDVARKRHSAYLVVGILSSYRGMGVGTKLFVELDHWAKNHQIHRLELTVVTKNEAAVRLYEKMGFQKEGVKEHSLYINGAYVDEYYMAKILGEE